MPNTICNKKLSKLVGEQGLDTVLRQMPLLHPSERQIMEMALADQTQGEISRVVGITQASVSYSISRATQRVEYLIRRPEFDPEQMRLDLTSVRFQDDDDVAILMEFWATGSQSVVARARGRTQGLIRYRISRSLDALTCLTTLGEDHREWVARCLAYHAALTELQSMGHILTRIPCGNRRGS